MERSDGERLATVEADLRAVREDVQDLRREDERKRRRLHDLESTTKGLVDLRRADDDSVNKRQRRIELRMQALTVAVAIAAVVEPFLYKLAGR